MKKKDCKHSELICIIALTLMIPILMGLVPMFYSWYSEGKNGLWMKSLYELLDANYYVNVPIFIILCYLTYRWCKRIWEDNDIRYFRPLLVLICFVLLFWKSQVTYAKIVWDFDYRLFLTVLLTIVMFIMFIKYICKKLPFKNRTKTELAEDAEQNPRVIGFSDDNPKNEEIPESLKNYASMIVKRLTSTKIEKHSFAIGVTGEWGVGKTTFLNQLKKEIEGKAEIVVFYPWMCRTPEQVTQDFFSSLRHQLSPKYSSLSKTIKDYAKIVGNLTIPAHTILGLDVSMPVTKESLYVKKQKLSAKFSNLPQPVAVFIDDLDRLERNEVFEVLRLIRNTADLSNTVYIVAYDKEYVTCVLEEKNIKDASSYLEKIFQVEIHLPKVEDSLIWKTLFEDINSQDDFHGNFAKLLYNKFNYDERALILRVLDNYRHAKRFSRLYMLNVSYLRQQIKGEIMLKDLFWLELLQMYDKRTYDTLASDPNCLLYYNRLDDRYYIRPGIIGTADESDMDAYRGKIFWKEETPKILTMMLRNSFDIDKRSICIPENYEKYFTLSVSPYKLSIKELNELFVDGSNHDDVVSKWINSRKYLNSISYQLKQVNVNSITDSQLQAYVRGVLSFGLRITNWRIYVLEVKNMLNQERYNSDKWKVAHDAVRLWIKEKMEDESVLPQLSNLLNCLYGAIVYDEQGKQVEPISMIINNEDVETMLKNIIERFLKRHPELTALDVMNKTGALGELFKNCCVLIEDAMNVRNECIYKQVAFDSIITHFAQKEVKPNQKKFDEALEAFHQETMVFDSAEDEDYYWNQYYNWYDQRMETYFGSSYYNKTDNKLEEFKIKCFTDKSKKKKK